MWHGPVFYRKILLLLINQEQLQKAGVKMQMRDDNDWYLITGYFRIIEDKEMEAVLVIDHIGRMRVQYGISFNEH